MPKSTQKRPLTKTDGEVRALTKSDLRGFKPASDVLALGFLEDLVRTQAKRGRGPQKAPVKTPVSIRLDADLVDHYRRGGPGWQVRVNAALRKAAGL